MRKLWKIVIAVAVVLVLVFLSFTIVQTRSTPDHLRASSTEEILTFIGHLHPDAVGNFSVDIGGERANIVVMADFDNQTPTGNVTPLLLYIAKTNVTGSDSSYITATVSSVTINYGPYYYSSGAVENFSISTGRGGGIETEGVQKGLNDQLLVYEFLYGAPEDSSFSSHPPANLTIKIEPSLLVFGPYYQTGHALVLSKEFKMG